MTDGKLNWSHQKGLFNPARARQTTLLGCGSVGSEVALMLVKCGVKNLTVYDADDIRSHNLPMTTVFRITDLGRLKVDVVREQVLAAASVTVKSISRMYAGEELMGSVIACVDTMEARMLAWKQVRMNPHVDLFVDTRIDRHFVSVYAIRPCEMDDITYYESQLYPTSQATKRTCGNHGVVYVSALAASIAVRALTECWSGDIPNAHERILLGNKGIHHTGMKREGEV